MSGAYTLHLYGGPAHREVVNYDGVPKVLVIFREGQWHDYDQVGATQYLHSPKCPCNPAYGAETR